MVSIAKHAIRIFPGDKQQKALKPIFGRKVSSRSNSVVFAFDRVALGKQFGSFMSAVAADAGDFHVERANQLFSYLTYHQ